MDLPNLAVIPVDEPDLKLACLDLTCLDGSESLATRFLTDSERDEFAALRHPGRRREWLGARICLKVMLMQSNQITHPSQCDVRKNGRGRPALSFLPEVRTADAVDCSLSHQGRYACAAISSRPGVTIGVDIEPVTPRLARLTPLFLSQHDTALHSRPHEMQLAVFWCLKEACSKALGLGLGAGLSELVCVETAAGRHQVTAPDDSEFRAWHYHFRDHVVALCRCLQGVPQLPAALVAVV